MSDPDEIWRVMAAPGQPIYTCDYHRDGTRYVHEDRLTEAEAREEKLADALRRLGEELRKAPLEIIPCVGSLTPIEHAFGLAWEALAAYDKREQPDG